MSVPDKIGRYRVVRRIGSGAFATVWLGADDALDASVAIKVLADNWSYHPDLRDRFTQEGRILRRADDPRLVRILDVGELPDGRPYLVMPFAAGGTLADRLNAGPLPPREALHVAAEIAGAVAVLHEHGVLHRDLKPSNVLFQPDRDRERILVADLGLAKALANASGFTVAAGSPGYMPPEQATPGGGLDVRADVYAIGATLYHMLTGRPPQRAGRAGPRPSQLRPGLPSAVDDLVRRALRADPRQRWASAPVFADALRRTAAAMEQHTARGRVRRRLGRAAGVAAAALAAVLALAGSAATLVTPPGWARVRDATGALSLAVPPEWAGQLRDAGWDPAALGLPAGHAPALVVSADLAAWPGGAAPGVFVGASRALAVLSERGPEPTFPEHGGCVRRPDRTVGVDRGGRALVRTWASCAGGVSFSEVTVAVPGRDFGIYLQIKQAGGLDRTDRVLAGLRWSAAAVYS
ncbi:serine/threonine-protein kinase [Dactylosporangium sp. NPDC049140]|uniref:serine/threonine-protein kinase n=1 Tax=Dactylosporangium sp. NPDC049140 TaxID=3155647 RepID=UPI0033CB77F9